MNIALGRVNLLERHGSDTRLRLLGPPDPLPGSL
jgi:hypothetical protein